MKRVLHGALGERGGLEGRPTHNRPKFRFVLQKFGCLAALLRVSAMAVVAHIEVAFANVSAYLLYGVVSALTLQFGLKLRTAIIQPTASLLKYSMLYVM